MLMIQVCFLVTLVSLSSGGEPSSDSDISLSGKILSSEGHRQIISTTSSTGSPDYTEGGVIHKDKPILVVNNTASTLNPKLTQDSGIAPKLGTQHSFPRKGVEFNTANIDSHELLQSSTKTNQTTAKNSTVLSSTTHRPMKPTATLGGEEPFLPSHLVAPALPKATPKPALSPSSSPPPNTLQPSNATRTAEPAPKVTPSSSSESPATEKSHKAKLEQIHKSKLDAYESGPDYIIPVVGSILAIPLFVGLIMLAYKYGADWWDRRHYRRMDYLIEGMYNN